MNFVVSWTRQALRFSPYGLRRPTRTRSVPLRRGSRKRSPRTRISKESREADVRIVIDPPLAALFVADLAIGVAYIVSVGWSGRPA